jgi:hypothetical protein
MGSGRSSPGPSLCSYSPECVEVDFSHLAAWHMASVKGSMGTPETFLGSVGAGNP